MTTEVSGKLRIPPKKPSLFSSGKDLNEPEIVQDHIFLLIRDHNPHVKKYLAHEYGNFLSDCFQKYFYLKGSFLVSKGFLSVFDGRGTVWYFIQIFWMRGVCYLNLPVFYNRGIYTTDYPIVKVLANFRCKFWQKEYTFSDQLIQCQKDKVKCLRHACVCTCAHKGCEVGRKWSEMTWEILGSSLTDSLLWALHSSLLPGQKDWCP